MTGGEAAHWVDLRHLFVEYAESLAISLEYQGFAGELQDLPRIYSDHEGGAWLALREGVAIGCVALKANTSESAELKRLYVRACGRGAGVGERLATAAITHARQLGYKTIRLDTLPTMAAAQRMYRRLGFVETEPYYDTPIEGTRFMALTL